MRPLFVLPLLLLSLQARAAEPQYLNAERDCRVAIGRPQPELSVTWDGACKDGYADGSGQLRWLLKGKPNGAYEGTLAKGLPNGAGYRLRPDGSSEDGNFVDGRLCGAGVYLSAKGDKLSATFEQGRPVGQVDYTTHEGDHYQGAWDGKAPHGQGTMSYALGGSYQGSWQHGKMDGKGRISYPNDEQLDGDFEQGHLLGTVVATTDAMRYSMREDNRRALIQRKTATGLPVPFKKAYAELTPAEQWVVKRAYPILQEQDEPPYPVGGVAAITQSFVDVQKKLLTEADFRLNVLIDADGKPSTADIFTAPTPELGRLAATILLLAKYKPAVCAGKPCAMRYPVHFRLTMER
ncbi:hypothetical protein ACFOLJ_10950 [Rugamonas sp. CCM 8940]|uniref:hypothetical protein n=1 Tax=Rugamonas sp. CCM 8940 TaxID=2765359 RepID=UPI0018F48269|nr:hypothetical protein [Rugamonas sp. CCM 8940]MBJ7309733.1 hypothetical protein [Rugamonas sp. CCM 8940]